MKLGQKVMSLAIILKLNIILHSKALNEDCTVFLWFIRKTPKKSETPDIQQERAANPMCIVLCQCFQEPFKDFQEST